MTLRAVPLTDEGRAQQAAIDRRQRIEDLRVDRSKVPHANTLPPSPPEALAAEQRIERARARLEHTTKLELLRAWFETYGDELPRQPIARR